MQQIISQFLNDIHQTSWLEFIAVITGIASVVFSRKENILVYPGGYDQHGHFYLAVFDSWAVCRCLR